MHTISFYTNIIVVPSYLCEETLQKILDNINYELTTTNVITADDDL